MIGFTLYIDEKIAEIREISTTTVAFSAEPPVSTTTSDFDAITALHKESSTLSINSSSAYGGSKNATEVLGKVPPECRVFDTHSDCARYSLKGQLLQSALSSRQRELSVNRSLNPRSSMSSMMLGSAMSNIFSSKAVRPDPFSAAGRESTSSVATGSGGSANMMHYHHNRRATGLMSGLMPAGNQKAPAFQMLITRLKMNNLFYLDILNIASATLHPYLIITIGGYSYKTAVQDSEVNPNWFAECPIELPVYAGEGENDQTSDDEDDNHASLNELSISLYYQGYFNDQFISQVVIPFTSFAPLKFEDKQFLLSDFSKSPRAATAAAKATAEGRILPTLTLSIN